MKRRSRWLTPLLFLLLPLLPLWKTLLGQCIGPTDQIRQMLPWSGSKPQQPWDVLQGDGVLQFLPWRDLVFDAWSKHQVPFWNNYELAGTPLLANSQSGALYPPHVLLGLLHVPTVLAIVILAWIHLAWAGYGANRLCLSAGGSKLGAKIAGISFCLAPFMLAWTALASVIETVAWIPWILYALYEVKDRRFIGVLGISTGMMLLAGHLQFAFYGLMAAGIVVGVTLLSNLVSKNRAAWPTLGASVAGLALGLMLSAAQLMPVLQYGKLSNRQNVPTEDGYSHYIDLAVKPFELGAIANPHALGYPRDEVDENLSSYWPMLVKNGANYAESAITIGPFILCLLGLVPWKDRRLLPLSVLGAVTFLLAIGTILNKALYFGIPGWSATGSPGRIQIMFVLSACVLAGCATVGQAEKPKGKTLIPVGVLLLVGVLLSLYAPILAPSVPGESAETAKTLAAMQSVAGVNSLITLLGGTLLAIAGLALLLIEKLAKFRPAVVAVPVLFCGLFFGLDLVSTGSPLPPIPKAPSQDRVAYINRNWSFFTVNPSNNTAPNLASLNRVHELGGYDSLVSGETVGMLQDVNGENPAPPANGNMMFIKKVNIDKLRDAGVSFIGSPNGLEPIPDAPGRCKLPGGTALIAAEDYSSLTVQTTGAGLLTVRDRLMPGWTATLDGQPVTMPPGIWRAVQIPTSGTHTVRFFYSAPGYSLGFILSFVALFCLVALFAPRNPADKRSAKPKEAALPETA